MDVLRSAGLSIAWLLSGCIFDLPSVLEADGCAGEDVPCGTACIAPASVCESGDARGEFTIQLTSAENGCMVPTWEQGSTSQVGATITQEGSQVDIALDGITGIFVVVGFGLRTEPVFRGEIEGDRILATIIGRGTSMLEGCTWQFDLVLDARLVGDNSIEGEVRFRPRRDNGHPDCPAYLQTCETYQVFSATRAPEAPMERETSP